jgi:hypothetical protein
LKKYIDAGWYPKRAPSLFARVFLEMARVSANFFISFANGVGRMLGTRVNLMPLFAKTLTWRPKLAMALQNVVHITRKNTIA